MAAARDDDRTRVLWVSKGLGPGGAERLLLSFARAGDQQRFAFRAAHLLPWKDQLVGPMRQAGVEVGCLDGARLADLRWVGRLRRLVAGERIEVVHLHSPAVAGLARPALASIRPRPAIVTTAHNVWPSFHPLTRALDQVTEPLDDHLFSVSHAVHESLPARMRERSEVLVHGVDVAGIGQRRGERDRRRAELGVADRRVVITIANLRADKDHRNLFAAAERVLAARHDVVFLVIGQGPLAEHLRTDLAGRGLDDRVRLLGHQEDPIAHLVAADVFALASRHEGLPIALLEALAAGLPVAATAVGGIPELVREGAEGRLVPPGDPVALAAAVTALLEPDTNRSCAAAALARAGAFDITRAVERQQDVYAALATGLR